MNTEISFEVVLLDLSEISFPDATAEWRERRSMSQMKRREVRSLTEQLRLRPNCIV